MDFKAATDRLMQLGVTLDEVAVAFGVARNSINRWRMPAGNRNARTVPPTWRDTLLTLACGRRDALDNFAVELERGG